MTLNYIVSDGRGGNVEGTATFNLEAVNDAPELTGAPEVLFENIAEDSAGLTIQASDLLANYSDVDGNALNITSFTIKDPLEGQPNQNVIPLEQRIGSIAEIQTSGSVTEYKFIPAANFNGFVRFDYTISDGQASLNQSYALEVTSVNDAPTGADKTIRATAGEFITLSPADFGFSDAIDRDVMQSVKLQLKDSNGNSVLTSDNLEITDDFLTQDEQTTVSKVLSFAQLAEGKVSLKAGTISSSTRIQFTVVDDGRVKPLAPMNLFQPIR